MAVTLDRDRLTPAAIDQPDWAGLEWSSWCDLASIETDLTTDGPGIYRLRHPAIDGLLAVVEFDQDSMSLGSQLTELVSAVYSDREGRSVPGSGAVDAELTRGLVRTGKRLDSTVFDVSYATPPRADRGRWFRRGLVAALIAIHRLITDRWPWPVDDDTLIRGVSKRLPPNLRTWNYWDQPRSSEWLGFDWTPPQRLEAIGETTVPDYGIYRTWRPAEAEGTLRYVSVGDGQAIRRHRPIDGNDARFSVAPIADIADASVASSGLRMELIGAHHLAIGHPPFRQFGGNNAADRITDK